MKLSSPTCICLHSLKAIHRIMHLTWVLAALFVVGATSSSSTWKFVSVTDFGAVGDNETDNTIAFRAALLAVASGGEVLVPNGVFQTAPFNREFFQDAIAFLCLTVRFGLHLLQ